MSVIAEKEAARVRLLSVLCVLIRHGLPNFAALPDFNVVALADMAAASFSTAAGEVRHPSYEGWRDLFCIGLIRSVRWVPTRPLKLGLGARNWIGAEDHIFELQRWNA